MSRGTFSPLFGIPDQGHNEALNKYIMRTLFQSFFYCKSVSQFCTLMLHVLYQVSSWYKTIIQTQQLLSLINPTHQSPLELGKGSTGTIESNFKYAKLHKVGKCWQYSWVKIWFEKRRKAPTIGRNVNGDKRRRATRPGSFWKERWREIQRAKEGKKACNSGEAEREVLVTNRQSLVTSLTKHSKTCN